MCNLIRLTKKIKRKIKKTQDIYIIKLSDLNSGVYFLKLKTKDFLKSKNVAVPETFFVLTKELKSLCVDVEFYKKGEENE